MKTFTKRFNKTKRGISPLIATVLLIGFVVAAFGVVMLWTRGFVEELQEKRGAEGTARLDCASDVEIGIRDLTFGGGQLTAVVENKRGRVDGFIFVVRGDTDSSSEEISTGIEPGGIANIDVAYDSVKVGQPDKIDVIPRLKLGKGVYQPCPDQKITWKVRIGEE